MKNFNLDSLLERLTTRYGAEKAQEIYNAIIRAIKK
jgi:hypothetical protein